MSSSRGRTLKLGGMATEPAGFSTRTAADQQAAPILRPAYQSPGGGTQFRPSGGAPIGGGSDGHPLLDFSGVTGWRLLFTIAAAAYLGFWFVSLGRGGLSGGVRL